MDALAVGPADIEVALQYLLHVFKHGIQIVAVRRRVVVTVVPGEPVREVAAAAYVHEFALPALLRQVDRCVARGFPARLVSYLIDGMIEDVEGCLLTPSPAMRSTSCASTVPSVMTVHNSTGW